MFYKACRNYFPVLLCTTKLAQSPSHYYFVLQTLHKVLPSTTLYYKACPLRSSTTLFYKACTKHFPVLLCTTQLAQTTSHYYCVLQSLQKLLPITTVYYKACTKSFPVLLCTTKLAQSTSQYYFVLQSWNKCVPSTTLYYKACTKHFSVLLCTTKLAQSTSQHYFVPQSLHKVVPSTSLYYNACTKHFPVLLCTTKLAQSTSQYYFVPQSLRKALPSTTLYHKLTWQFAWKSSKRRVPYRHSDATVKPETRDETRGRSKTRILFETPSTFDTFNTLSNRLECHKVPRLPSKTTWQPAWKPSKRKGFAASPKDTELPTWRRREADPTTTRRATQGAIILISEARWTVGPRSISLAAEQTVRPRSYSSWQDVQWLIILISEARWTVGPWSIFLAGWTVGPRSIFLAAEQTVRPRSYHWEVLSASFVVQSSTGK